MEDCIPTQARVRVLINGLNPLDMTRDISLPSGEIIEVEFSYDNLQKIASDATHFPMRKMTVPHWRTLGNEIEALTG